MGDPRLRVLLSGFKKTVSDLYLKQEVTGQSGEQQLFLFASGFNPASCQDLVDRRQCCQNFG